MERRLATQLLAGVAAPASVHICEQLAETQVVQCARYYTASGNDFVCTAEGGRGHSAEREGEMIQTIRHHARAATVGPWAVVPVMASGRHAGAFAVEAAAPISPEQLLDCLSECARLYEAYQRSRTHLGTLEAEIARLRSVTQAQDEIVRETHHRVKNNLQIISSLLDLQIDEGVDGAAAKLVRDSQNRIISMAHVHDELYRTGATECFSTSRLSLELAEHLRLMYDGVGVGLNVRAEDVPLSAGQAVPLALILTELVSNAFEHAFDETIPAPAVGVSLSREAGSVVCEVTDNGLGIHDAPDGLGMRLVKMLVGQLGGEFTVKSFECTVARAVFPVHRGGKR